jgi:thiol:disulfide interchange protein DsbD
MAVLVTLIALNLFGVFEVTLASGTLSAAAGLASKKGAAGAFFNGLLATVLATSCSAPILAVAAGFVSSLKNSAVTIIAVMLTMGVGLAFPYLLLSWQPAWLKFLPRPGQWMQRFKVAMGFPMAAAAIWLCSLGRIHYGDRAWWMTMFLIFVAVAAWIYGEFVQRGTKRRGLAVAFILALLFAGYAFALEREMQWRNPVDEATAARQSKVAPRGVPWENWSADAVAAAREAGRPVVIDFTATWCPTCNAIVKPSFENSGVQKKLKEINALALVADYSRRPKKITEELRRFERGAVPLVVIYPRNREAQPMVFDLVRPGTLLDALDKAAQ